MVDFAFTELILVYNETQINYGSKVHKSCS